MDPRSLLTPLIVLAIVALAFVGYVWVTQRSLIYFPDRSAPSASALPPGGQEISFHTDDGLELNGWFLPAERASMPVPGPAVLVLNGNAGNRGDRVPLANALREMGASVLLVEYRGYGGNPGEPSEGGLRGDAQAAYASLAARDDVDPDRIAVFGESLGAAVAVGLALTLAEEGQPPATLVLRSPFASLAEVGRHHYPWLPVVDPLLWDRYPVASSMARIDTPVLVVAGDADEVVPTDQSRAVYEAAAEPKRWVVIAGAHHNDPALFDGPELLDAVRSFLIDHGVLDG